MTASIEVSKETHLHIKQPQEPAPHRTKSLKPFAPLVEPPLPKQAAPSAPEKITKSPLSTEFKLTRNDANSQPVFPDNLLDTNTQDTFQSTAFSTQPASSLETIDPPTPSILGPIADEELLSFHRAPNKAQSKGPTQPLPTGSLVPVSPLKESKPSSVRPTSTAVLAPLHANSVLIDDTIQAPPKPTKKPKKPEPSLDNPNQLLDFLDDDEEESPTIMSPVDVDPEQQRNITPLPPPAKNNETMPLGAYSEELGTIERPALDIPTPPAKKKSKDAPSMDALFRDFARQDEQLLAEALDLSPLPARTTEMTPPELHPSAPNQSTTALADGPTVARAIPNTLAQIRGDRQREATAIRHIVGDGLSASPETNKPRPLSATTVEAWKKTDKPHFFEADALQQKAQLYFLFPLEKARILDKHGKLSFYIQLHRLSTYPLLSILLSFQNADDELQDALYCPIDPEDTQALIFLDLLMQDFSLTIHLCNEPSTAYREIHVNLPLEQNVEYILNEARRWKDTLSPKALSYAKALGQFEDPDFERLGKMTHNFNQDSFSQVNAPSMARLASGIVAYWSESEQFDYLVATKSFPMPYFRSIQRRVIESSLEFGIYMPEILAQEAVRLGFADNAPDIYRRLRSNFAELNLHIRQPNDLDPWDNLDNWQKLLEACDKYNIEVDPEIEELAESAQRKCHEEGEISVESAEEIEIFEDFQEMNISDLLELLKKPEHRMEAAAALCDRADPATIEQVAAIFPEISREETPRFAELFTQFGAEAEDYLISWLPLPRSYQREAAMLALGTMGSEKAIDSIIKRLRSGEEWETAAEALGRIGESAVPFLARELKNKNWLIRLRAIKALGKVETGEARKLIEQLARDPHETVKAEVANLLKK